jgi:hypothetical protein
VPAEEEAEADADAAPPAPPAHFEVCEEERRPNAVVVVEGEYTKQQCRDECFSRGAPSWSYRTTFGNDHSNDTTVPVGWVPLARPLPQCLCADTDTFMGFVDDPDFDTYSMAGAQRMPLHYQDAIITDAPSADFKLDCRRACLKMNASLWYAAWNPYGRANYADTGASRCRCSDPTSAMPSQLVEDPGYHTWSLAGPHAGLRPFHKLDGFDLELDECIRHCGTVVPNSTWVALWSPIGELNGGLNSGGVFEQSKRCLCEDTSKEYAIDDDPSYDLYSLRGEC